MSDPKEQQREPDELELESETVADLEVKEQEGEQVRGGCINGSCVNTRPA